MWGVINELYMHIIVVAFIDIGFVPGFEIWIPYDGYSRSQHENFFLDVWENTQLKNFFAVSGSSTSGPVGNPGFDLVFENNRHRIVLNGGSITSLRLSVGAKVPFCVNRG